MTVQDVTAKPGENALFIIYDVKKGDKALTAVKKFCGLFPAIVKSMQNRFPDADIKGLMGFGVKAFERLLPKSPKPLELEIFQEIKGQKHTAVSTPGDLFFHLRSKRRDVIFEISSIINEELDLSVTSVDEVHGFRYLDSRAIIGFVDGTENPQDDAASEFAVIGDEDIDFKGGSYAFVQKYIHDFKAWKALSVEEQEKVIGRRKYDDRELDAEEKPDNAHNAVTNISDPNGNELKIVRANMAFANPSKGEFGTYFIGYARTFSTTKKMLENMFLGDPLGNYDRLLDFSKAVTGTLFFIPTEEFLGSIEE